MREFAEQEIVIPDGPFKDLKFRCDRQPYSRLFFDAVDSGNWNRIFALGPTQTGKTLTCWAIPIMYHLFEIGETVICGVPMGDMAKDKWKQDLLPVIEASRYRDYLPRKGAGSQGGFNPLVKFLNGASLRFMYGGGSDQTRAAFTSRVLCVTETEGFDKSAETSREADKFTQLEGRTRAFGERKRIYAECTVSIDTGRTWREYESGTRSRILLPCPACQKYVQIERENLKGWQEHTTEHEARDAACYVCPECDHAWTEDERKQANIEAVLAHGDQEIQDGHPIGELPRTNTLGFRWSAVNNMFLSAGDVAVDEYTARTDEDADNAEKKLRQFVWALPHEPDAEDAVELSLESICQRKHDFSRGVYPNDTVHTTIGFDSGKYQSWFLELAWTADHRAYIVNYGSVAVSTNDLGLEQATLATLHGFAEDCLQNTQSPDAVWYDASYETQVHYRFKRETLANFFQPVQGYGSSQRNAYVHPANKNRTVRKIGEQWYVVRDIDQRISRVDLNADYWKLKAQKGLTGPVDRPCAVTLFNAPSLEHTTFGKHVLAEKQIEVFEAGKGTVTKWEKRQKQNHLFDCLAYAMAAGSSLGHSSVKAEAPAKSAGTSFASIAKEKRARR